MADMTKHDGLISELVSLTGASPTDARHYLTTNQWDLSDAATAFYTAQEEEDTAHDVPADYYGPRTLDGRPAPQAVPAIPAVSRSGNRPSRGGIATLSSLASSSRGQSSFGNDDDDDDDYQDPDHGPRDLFAGGEKSGLAVQDPANRNDPRKVVNDILKKARANAARAGDDATPAVSSRISGGGRTLGSVDTPSTTIPADVPSSQDSGPTQTRILHLWEDGFSVEDGPLRRFDDAQNAADLNMIRQGRAPLHLMDVRHDQPVDVQLIKHDTVYTPPPKVYKPFSGVGHRLGSPTPGTTDTSTPSTNVATTSTPSPSSNHDIVVDPAQPTLVLRLQLADGTRLPARFNTSHTIGDVYSFIEKASSGSASRPWVLATTFPNRDHTDKSMTLGDMAEFKRGGTAVQKWI